MGLLCQQIRFLGDTDTVWTLCCASAVGPISAHPLPGTATHWALAKVGCTNATHCSSLDLVFFKMDQTMSDHTTSKQVLRPLGIYFEHTWTTNSHMLLSFGPFPVPSLSVYTMFNYTVYITYILLWLYTAIWLFIAYISSSRTIGDHLRVFPKGAEAMNWKGLRAPRR